MTKRLCRNLRCDAVMIAVAVMAFAVPALAQVMPPPHSAPRTPVNRQALAGRAVVPPAREVQGQATIIDGEKLRIGEADLRLFGVVPPQLSASFGPQARALLDGLVQGQSVTCHVRDRDHDGRLLATCTSNGNDLSMELLKHGLAVTARGSIAGTDLAQPYLAAEAAAQNQKVGLWTVTVPPAAAVAAVAATPEPAKVEAPAPSVVVIPEAKKEEAKKEDKETAKEAARESKAETPAPATKTAAPFNGISSPILASVVAANAAATENEKYIALGGQNIFARFQILIAGFLMLATALAILIVFGYQRRQERREEMKAIAAALRGELLGARTVCQMRLKIIQSDEDERSATWPRLRSTLYQAYVGRLGFLGAALARQVASIYGQASDYAAYYSSASDDTHAVMTSKRHALQTLLSHIEEILPRLAMVERTGQIPHIRMPMSKHQVSGPDVAPRKAVAPPAAPKTAAATTPAAGDAALQRMQETMATMWESLRKFAQDYLPERRAHSANDDTADYTALIEQEIANMSFGDGEDDPVSGSGGDKKHGNHGR